MKKVMMVYNAKVLYEGNQVMYRKGAGMPAIALSFGAGILSLILFLICLAFRDSVKEPMFLVVAGIVPITPVLVKGYRNYISLDFEKGTVFKAYYIFKWKLFTSKETPFSISNLKILYSKQIVDDVERVYCKFLSITPEKKPINLITFAHNENGSAFYRFMKSKYPELNIQNEKDWYQH